LADPRPVGADGLGPAACLFHNLVTSGRVDQARVALQDARDTVESSGDVRASFTLRLAESALEYARCSKPGRLLLRMGQLSEARAALEGRFDLEDGTRAAAVLDAAGIVALGRLALHLGDTRQIRRLSDIAHVMFERGTPAVRRHAGWLLALYALSDGDPAAAQKWVRAEVDQDGRPILPRFPMDIGDEVHLARIALASDDDELAQLALATARRRAALNPDIASIVAAAAHVSGLLESSPGELEEAMSLFEHGPRRLEYASALEDLGGSLVATDSDAGIDTFSRALAVYVEIGAAWDARRVRSRLRDLGVRRRIVPGEPELTGWAAITGSELAVARLVAEGLTNREVAERLFVSPHTVNSHLRHVFAKLGINSRVELARRLATAKRADVPSWLGDVSNGSRSGGPD
jgi:DNA-binding CsgD family transcriptional regulator